MSTYKFKNVAKPTESSSQRNLQILITQNKRRAAYDPSLYSKSYCYAVNKPTWQTF